VQCPDPSITSEELDPIYLFFRKQLVNNNLYKIARMFEEKERERERGKNRMEILKPVEYPMFARNQELH